MPTYRSNRIPVSRRVVCHPVCENPSPLFRGEREGPLAHRRCAIRQAHARVRREGREGEVGGAANRFVGPLTLPSPPGGGGEGKQTRCTRSRQVDPVPPVYAGSV